eukprot:gb/GEZN01006476.1/.p1 GENE.gb/GEZN01006476.1/~~gb/GEZN01006476.1/.p1  ORF type:complete len:547 (-),score=54.51 gb/GEZN01006476.1/:18-1562(-)
MGGSSGLSDFAQFGLLATDPTGGGFAMLCGPCCYVVWLVSFCLLCRATYARACDWNYDDSTGQGPSEWKNLCHGTYKLCGEGLIQSPVDIPLPDWKEERMLAERNINFKLGVEGEETELEFEFSKAGPTFRVLYPTTSLLPSFWPHIQNEDLPSPEAYLLVQLRVHSPSEHKLQGRQFPLELQLIHRVIDVDEKSEAADSNVTWVNVALLLEKAAVEPASSFAQLDSASPAGVVWKLLNVSSDFGQSIKLKVSDLYRWADGVGDHGHRVLTFSRYQGSHTIPPCSPTVSWLVGNRPLGVPADVLRVLQDNLGRRANSRPVQPLNGRSVSLNILSEFIRTDCTKDCEHKQEEQIDQVIGVFQREQGDHVRTTSTPLEKLRTSLGFNISAHGFLLRLCVPLVSLLGFLRSWRRGSTALPDAVYCWGCVDCRRPATMLGGFPLPGDIYQPGSAGKSKETPHRKHEHDKKMVSFKGGRKLGFVLKGSPVRSMKDPGQELNRQEYNEYARQFEEIATQA